MADHDACGNGFHMVLTGPIRRASVAELCEQAAGIIEATAPGPVTCDVSELGPPDLVAVDLLARLHLKAARRGRSLQVCNPSRELRDLLAFAGLDGVLLADCGPSDWRLRGQPEEGEELVVDEDVDGRDPPV